ncbi:MAG TPA: valine--tRNA ligase [Candidatus Limnocylindria bacterium]|nr:valine--tRNA ligase [Candidatus Limnocylindria bacterium]
MAKQIDPPAAVLDFNEKNFRPSVVETELYDWWERSGFFTPPAPSPDERRFVMMLPLPNVTGDLHMGHALGFGGYEDLMARWHRMKGDATLYLPGTDHAGIIAQILLEKELAKETDKKSLTREQFLDEMWKWMRFYQPRIYKQLRMLGCSLDWTRVHFTMDPDMQQRVRTHFIRMYRRGHLYRADRIVHWCLTCQTTFSDLELLHVTRTDQLSYVRYPWADKMPAGTPDVIVATTRPETIVADTAVAVHPDDARWKAYVGKEVLVPMVERRVKIIVDEAVDPTFGTGALKVTPGHDATDFEIGQRHGLPVVTAIDKSGKMTPAAGILAGAHRDAARAKAIELLKGKGLLVRQEPITHAVGIHDRCGTIEEPLVLKQWWMRMAPLAKPAIDAVRSGRIRIVPKYQEKIFFEWMENIRDWAIGRQIWWGHSIPVWYCKDCDEIVVPDENGPDPTSCPKCRGTDLRKDPDVLDTWFSSALWPHTTLGWPDKTKDLARFYPGQMLETGYDILFFWVARMIMMGIENMGDVPFDSVYLHGLVRVASGEGRSEKMSKSKGNVESPVGVIEEQGADTLRFALVNGVSAGADSQLSEGKLQNAKEFANKLWNVGRYVLRALEAHPQTGWAADRSPWTDPALGPAERWILSRTEATVAELTRLIESYHFGEYAAALQQFVWSELADVYIELSKQSLREPSRAGAAAKTLAYVLDRVLRLAHPVMPFISDTLALQLWRALPNTDRTPSLVIARWPEAKGRDEQIEDRFAVLIEVVRAIRNLRQNAGIRHGQPAKVALGGDTSAIRELAGAIAHLSQSEVTFGSGTGATTVVRAVEVRLAADHDPAEHRARLERELLDARDALRRSTELLAKPGFAEKAPPSVVDNEKARLAEREERVRLLEDELKRKT